MIKLKRRTARIHAVKALYLYEKSGDREKSIKNSIKGLPKEVSEFALTLYRGVLDNLNEIDSIIERVLENYTLKRVYSIDRNIIRLGAYEILFTDIDPPVAINEAIEIAKTLSEKNSGSFVNAVLDKIKCLKLEKK